MPEADVMPSAEAQPATPQPAGRKPWHAPTLTEVTLQVTGQLSGSGQDNVGRTTTVV